MARPVRKHPAPTLSHRGGSQRIRWYSGGQLYEITLGPLPDDDARALTTLAGAALAGRIDWPAELATAPAVTLYNQRKNALPDTETEDEKLILGYVQHLRANSRSLWYQSVKGHLEQAHAHMKALKNAQPLQLSAYFDSLLQHNKPATRNRAKAALSGFYNWLRAIGLHPKGYRPLENIRTLTEERPAEGIITWDDKGVAELLHAADALPDGIAVWLALYAGLRRGEIAALRWEDVTPSYIVVRKSKTGRQRQVPLASKLAERLKREKREGERVVPWPEAFNGWNSAAKRLMKENLPRKLTTLYAKHPECFGFNPLRHTFASRHAQAGHSLDLIAAWLGDSPKVCRDHYARFVPKDRRDERIDLPDLPTPKPPRKPRAPRKPGNLAFQFFEHDGVVVSASSSKAGRRRADNGLWHVVDGVTDTTVDYYGQLTWQDATPGEFPDWLEIHLPQSTRVGRVVVYPYAQSLRDYAVQVFTNGGWRDVDRVQGRKEDRIEHTFAPVATDRVRLWITATNGPVSRVTEVEVYAD